MTKREDIMDVDSLRRLISTTDPKFWRRVDTSSDEGCWPFLGYCLPNGYGQIKRVIDGQKVSYVTHKFVYELIHGEVPEGKKVCHDCDNPPCVRPDHLWLGTQAENLKDARDKGRAVPFGGKRADNQGERHGMALLTEEAVIEIRYLWSLGQHTQRQLAEMFGVSRGAICSVVRGQSWKHLIGREDNVTRNHHRP